VCATNVYWLMRGGLCCVCVLDVEYRTQSRLFTRVSAQRKRGKKVWRPRSKKCVAMRLAERREATFAIVRVSGGSRAVRLVRTGQLQLVHEA
jgi:hypothetical protein